LAVKNISELNEALTDKGGWI